jgi:hypothetical protein
MTFPTKNQFILRTRAAAEAHSQQPYHPHRRCGGKRRKAYTRRFLQMSRLSNKGSWRAVIWALVWFVGVLLLSGVLYFASDLNATNKSIGFADVQPSVAPGATDKPKDKTSDTLEVWLDTGKSIDGFLYDSSKNVIPSAYRAVADSLPDLALAVGNTASAKCYYFNSVFSFLDAALTDSDRQQKRDELTIALSNYKNPLSAELSGIDDVTVGGKSVSLPSVLNALNLKNPSIILTDFEADGLTLPGEEYRLPLERIYNAGLCVYVVGMKSAFSGILYNYINSGVDYAYGTKANADCTRLNNNNNVYSYQARPFYAIIVATGSQCEKLKDELQQTYDVYGKAVVNGKESLQKIKGYNAEDYIGFNTANYCLNGTYDVITAVDGKAAAVTEGEGFKPAGTDASGVPEFSCVKTETLKTATLNFTIVPASAAYAATYKTDAYSIPEINVQKVELTYTTADQLKDGETVMEARGNRRVLPYYADFTDSGKWFAFSKITPLEGGITFTLTVDAAQCKAGLYSLTIPITCEHSTEANETSDVAWIDNWTEDSLKLSKDINDDKYVLLKTVDLKAQLEYFRTTDLKQNHKETDDVANLTIHLNIQ